MNNTDYKIVYKKPNDYENSSKSSSDSDNETLKLYVKNNLDQDFSILNKNINLDYDVLIEKDIDNLILILDKLEEKDDIKKDINDYLNLKDYSEEIKNNLLLKLKNRVNYLNTNQIIKPDIKNNNINNYTNNKKDNSVLDYNSSKCLAITAIIITIIIVIVLFTKYYKELK